MRKEYEIRCGRHCLKLGRRTCVMGVLNVTPDSFSDGGKFFTPESAVVQGKILAMDGADILDIGGESTRPFSEPVGQEEEISRVIPIIEQLADQIDIPISIDTTKALVAKKAIEAGASIINDIGALRFDPEMINIAADCDVPLILMHMLGLPKTMQENIVYNDLINDIKLFLQYSARRAVDHGIKKSKIIIDPGIGFGKTFDHNLQIIKHLSEFEELDFPVLVGPSRKKFIQNTIKDDFLYEIHPDMPPVEIGTQAVIAASILNGAHIVRVHNVADTCITAKIIDAIEGN